MAENPKVIIQTNQGDIRLELYADKAPQTVANFLAYAEDDFYQETIFHRVIDGFMIQGGGYTSGYRAKPTREPVQNESKNGISNERGTIAMARTSNPHSATAQFFINLVDNTRLDYNNGQWGYTAFGRVTEGMDVVDAISGLPTGSGGPFRTDVPKQAVVIQDIRRLNPDAAKK